MGDMTITEFLIARIAEDEARASWYHRLHCLRTACDAECCWGDATDEQTDAERVCTCGYPARVLADCEAKRRIIALHIPGDDFPDNPACVLCQWDVDCEAPRHDHQYEAGKRSEWPCETVLALASVYVDHPDFDETWRI